MTQVNLSIFNFKYMKAIVRFIIVFFVIFYICKILNYIYVEPDEWSEKLWNDYYSESKNIDYLYLGSSHVYCGINPYLLDELNGKNNFNLSSHQQLLNGTYYLLKEASRKNDIKHVYLDMYFMSSAYYEYSSQLYRNWCNIDYMENSLNKLEYIFNIDAKGSYLETLFPFMRYRNDLFNIDDIKHNINERKKINGRVYMYQSGGDTFAGKGYRIRDWNLQVEDLNCEKYEMADEPMLEEAKKYLRKIIEFCQHENIELTLFSAPMYELAIFAQGNYDAYVKQVKSIANEYGIEYYDFNLCRDNYLPIQELEYFADSGHLNRIGADMFSRFFWQVVSGSPEENEKYFYYSFSEKLQKMKPQVYGVIYTESVDNSNEIEFEIAENYPMEMEHRILLTSENMETRMYQDFSTNSKFFVPIDEHGICTIVSRKIGEEDKVQTLEISY